MSRIHSSIIALVAAVGCSTAPASPPDGGVTSSGPGPLEIVSLSATVSAITSETEAMALPSTASSVQLVAIVTDEDGLDAIAGGTLTDETGVTYGAFGAGANKGTYTATLDWTAASQVRTLDVPAGGTSRTFTATFFDNRGRTASASQPITFFCGANHDHVACAGVCEDQTTLHDNCGACGVTCPGQQACYDGTCADLPHNQPTDELPGWCVDRTAYPTIASCSDFCQRAGGYCYGDQNGIVYEDLHQCTYGNFAGERLGCDGLFTSASSTSGVYCYCAF